MSVEAKVLVHEVTNKMQAVLGYFELQEFPKAKKEIWEAIRLLNRLRERITTLEHCPKALLCEENPNPTNLRILPADAKKLKMPEAK